MRSCTDHSRGWCTYAGAQQPLLVSAPHHLQLIIFVLPYGILPVRFKVLAGPQAQQPHGWSEDQLVKSGNQELVHSLSIPWIMRKGT